MGGIRPDRIILQNLDIEQGDWYDVTLVDYLWNDDSALTKMKMTSVQGHAMRIRLTYDADGNEIKLVMAMKDSGSTFRDMLRFSGIYRDGRLVERFTSHDTCLQNPVCAVDVPSLGSRFLGRQSLASDAVTAIP